MKLLKYSVDSYKSNFRLILLFSLPFLVAFMIPILIPLPTYPAVGGIYLRTGSLPAITMLDAGIMILAYLAALYLVSFAIVNINIVIKSQRTTLNIRKEVLKSISSTALNVFLLYILFTLSLLLIQLITYTVPHRELIASVLNMLVSIPFFYAPAAMVIDELPVERALKESVSQVIKKPEFFGLWTVLGLLLVSLAEVCCDTIFGSPMNAYVSIFINSVIILPFMIVMQTQMYLAKYPILS
ncbi:hypothetical protein J7K41_04445 [Candidatus Micrarchaeota archaeon]|nr:hypothetical protein [Candidatus Micrarchaeota archaeon]